MQSDRIWCPPKLHIRNIKKKLRIPFASAECRGEIKGMDKGLDRGIRLQMDIVNSPDDTIPLDILIFDFVKDIIKEILLGVALMRPAWSLDG